MNKATLAFCIRRKPHVHSLSKSYGNSHNDTNGLFQISNNDKYCNITDDFGCQALEIHTFPPKSNEQWIRIELEPPDISHISKEEVMQQISQAEKDQSAYGRSDLYQRDWLPVGDEGMIPAQEKGTDLDNLFTVLQFNVLAEGLSFGPNARSPFTPTQRLQEFKAKNTYGGFTSVKHPEVCFNYQLRRWRLLQAILDVDADIIGLEEVDRFHGFFLPMLKKFGYEGIFLPKVHSPGVKLGWYSDGCALIFRSNMFKLEGFKHHKYSRGNQVCIVARLRHRLTHQVIKLVVTHLKAQQNEKCELIRKQQVDQILQEFLNETTSIEEEPIIVLGDFNSEPSSESVKKVRGFLQSAYDLERDEKLVTTWKTRGNSTVRRVIDYIFYSTNLQLKSILSIPFETVEEEKMPSLRYPSDHILIAAKFELP